MISRGLKVALVMLVVVGGIVTFVGFRLANNKLRQRMDALRQSQVESERLREGNRRTKALLAQGAGDKDAAADAIQAEVGRLRREVDELEKRAVEKREQRTAQMAADAEALANNRDPAQGLTRLEHFRDVGVATPAAAFQTFVWAAIVGADEKLAELIAFPGDGRREAMEIVAGLTDTDRAKYPTPEKLAALFFADAFTSMSAAQIIDVAMADAQHAIVRVRGLTTKEEKIPLQLGASGWQVVVPEAMVGKLKSWAQPAARPPAKS
jgi:hypothetical protein